MGRIHPEIRPLDYWMANPGQLKARLQAKTRRVGECLIWTGARSGDGYGMVVMASRRYGSRAFRAHHVAWWVETGRLPDSPILRHTCDTPLCVEFGHLVSGTQMENAHDRDDRERTNHAQFTKLQVEAIRGRRPWTTSEIGDVAKEYGVSRDAIWKVITGRTFKRFGGPILPPELCPGRGGRLIKVDGRFVIVSQSDATG